MNLPLRLYKTLGIGFLVFIGTLSFAETTTLSANPTKAELFAARVLAEPLVPSATPAEADNRAVAATLRAFEKGIHPDDFSALKFFAAAHLDSPGRPAILSNSKVCICE